LEEGQFGQISADADTQADAALADHGLGRVRKKIEEFR
jgi:hypothetical protein